MTDVELLATRASDGLRTLLGRLASLAFGLVIVSGLIGLAAYASGFLAFDTNAWPVVGAVICLFPAAAALLAWWRIKRTQRVAPAALNDLRAVIADQQSRPAMDVLIDMDSGQRIVTTSRSMTDLLRQLKARQTDWPALVDTITAVTTVPGLVAIAILGVIGVGALGTVLLLIGLLS